MSADAFDRARAFFADADEPVPPPRRGRYEIVREIARGGMAVVYEARDPELRRSVALKVLKDPDPARLRREASAASALHHPNVVTIHEIGPDWLVMDLIRGRTLAEAQASLTRDERLRILETVARAAGYAHTQGVVHRDLKPGNILLAEDGRPVITDFGLARREGAADLTRSGSVFGTPHYMAPEQVRGDARLGGPGVDVWALGVLLHETLAGVRPFEGATPLEIYDRVVHAEAPRLPGPLGLVAAKALDKDPARRYPDGTAFADDLARVLAGDAPEARPRGRLSRAALLIRRHPAAWGFAATAALAFAAAFLAATWGQAERERAIVALRDQAHVSLEAALALRRAGALSQLPPFFAPLEAACREASRLNPGSPEPDYLRGRMHRALFEDEPALAAQEAALGKNSAHGPAHYERAILLSRKLGDPVRLLGDETRDEDSAALREEIRRDAAAYLERPLPAAGLPPAAPLIAAALLALAEGRPGDGRAPLEQALAADPLLEEARELLSRCIRAGVALDHEGWERRWRDQEDLLTRGLERDRGYLPHWFARGELRWQRGSRRRHRGLDPRSDYHAAESDFTSAIELSPRTLRGWHWRGQVRVYLALWQIETNGEPVPLLDAALEDLTKAVQLDPAPSSGWLWRGNARFYRGVWEQSRNRDALAHFEASERDLCEAVARAQEPSAERRWRGRLRAQYGAALGRSGRDPALVFESALEDFAPLVRGQEKDAWVWMWRSTVFSERAEWMRSRGRDPEADYAQALSDLDRSVGFSPGLMEVWKHRGLVRWQRARHREAAGRDARVDYAAAAADFLEALSLNPVMKHQIGDRAEESRRKAAGP